MPSQAEIKKLGVNPFAIAASQGHKPGTAKYERVVMAITRDARSRRKKRKRKIGMKRKKK